MEGVEGVEGVKGVKVCVDTELCVGHGRCYVLAPDVFAADEYGHSVVRVVEIDPADRALADQARLGASNCPEGAITVDG